MPENHTTCLFYQLMESPLGNIRIVADERNVLAVDFWDVNEPVEKVPNALTQEARKQLQSYFEHQLDTFDLPLMPKGTDFQQKVWKGLRDIPYGRTTSYLAFSRQLGNEKAIRAVGHANGQNPIAIIVPCHRVIGSNGSLVGYGGGLWRKKWLLRHEGVAMQGELPFSLK
jgi:methylated-DNA-[protein]-cysteine S-methyltransferase